MTNHPKSLRSGSISRAEKTSCAVNPTCAGGERKAKGKSKPSCLRV